MIIAPESWFIATTTPDSGPIPTGCRTLGPLSPGFPLSGNCCKVIRSNNWTNITSVFLWYPVDYLDTQQICSLQSPLHSRDTDYHCMPEPWFWTRARRLKNTGTKIPIPAKRLCWLQDYNIRQNFVPSSHLSTERAKIMMRVLRQLKMMRRWEGYAANEDDDDEDRNSDEDDGRGQCSRNLTQISGVFFGDSKSKGKIPGEVHSSLSTSIGQLSGGWPLARHEISVRLLFLVQALHSLHCGVKTEQNHI